MLRMNASGNSDRSRRFLCSDMGRASILCPARSRSGEITALPGFIPWNTMSADLPIQL